MTNKELQDKLKNLPDDSQVYIAYPIDEPSGHCIELVNENMIREAKVPNGEAFNIILIHIPSYE